MGMIVGLLRFVSAISILKSITRNDVVSVFFQFVQFIHLKYFLMRTITLIITEMNEHTSVYCYSINHLEHFLYKVIFLSKFLNRSFKPL